MKTLVGTTKCNAIEQLNDAAEKYAIDNCLPKSDKTVFETTHWIQHNIFCEGYKIGALSPEAANGCNKHVEKAKIEFAIEQLRWLQPKSISPYYQLIENRISELQTKLKKYE